MLNERELSIIKYLAERQERFVTSLELADVLGVSVRTIKTSLNSLQNYLASTNKIELKTVRSKGITLEVQDLKYLQSIIEETERNNLLYHNNPNNRVNHIILTLIKTKKTKVELQHIFHISESTLNGDLEKVKEVLERYDLVIDKESTNKLMISGNELSIRKMIGQLNDLNSPVTKEHLFSIENIILKILIEEEYNVTEQVFNNILVHIQISIERIKAGELITKTKSDAAYWVNELKISNRIFRELARVFDIPIVEGEVINLAILLVGKSDYDNQNYIPELVSDFIDKSLDEIDEKFNVKFSINIADKLNLSLHLVPLLERLKHDVRLNSQLTDYINQSFPLAIDISAFFSMKIQEEFKVTVSEEEIAYLAIHFNNFIINFDQHLGKKEILIISNIRRSESILLKQRLLTWFKEEISNVEVVNHSEVMAIDFDKFDVIFTTDDNDFVNQFAPILISKFPSDAEYLSLKLAIDGFKDKDDIISLFRKELFYIGKFNSKKEVFDKFASLIQPVVGVISDQFMESVILREEMSNTYFNNRIAFPHPAVPLSVESFVSTIILEDPIVWNEDLDKVKIVMLIAIERNNTKSFQLWNYLSGLTKDEMFSLRLRDIKHYDDFVKNLNISIEYNN